MQLKDTGDERVINMHFDGGKNSTRFLEQNIHNLAYAQYEGEGDFDIPVMKPVHIDNLEDIPLQGFNFALKEKHPENIGVHFFLHDYQFERVWKYPDRYLDVLKKFAFVLSPDFSPYADSPRAVQIYNLYRNRWCGRYWQEYGINVIPTFTVGDASMFSTFCCGIPKHSTIAVSTMGEGRWGQYKWLRTWWDAILNALEPETVLLYGKDLTDELKGNIVFKKLISSKVAI